MWLQGEGTQFGCCFPSVSLNANSDPLHVSWPSSAAMPFLSIIKLLGFPLRAELSEHGSGDKDSLLLVSPPQSLDLWLLLFIVNLGVTYSAVGRGAARTLFCRDFWSSRCFPLWAGLRWVYDADECILGQTGASVFISDNIWMWNLSPAHYKSKLMK